MRKDREGFEKRERRDREESGVRENVEVMRNWGGRASERERREREEREQEGERERECVGEGIRESREGVRKLGDWAKEKVERLCKSGEGVRESESGEGVKERVERVCLRELGVCESGECVCVREREWGLCVRGRENGECV